MQKSLIITEKPSVARDIVEALGGFASHKDEYWESDALVCTFAVGHVLELLQPEDIDPIYKRWSFDSLPIIPEEFKVKPKSAHSVRIKVIEKLIERDDVKTLINACDAGREGELIFRELIRFTESTKPIERLWLQSMTTDSIRRGFASLQDGKKFEGLASAAWCRSLADWLIGMNASRALTIRLRSKSMKGAWSAGRVQTPTLALLVDRELEVLSHVPVPYWRVLARFAAKDHTYDAVWTDPDFKSDEDKPQHKADRIFDEALAASIVAAVTEKPGLASETRKPSRESAPPLFDLTSLQRAANGRFGWSAARTLQAAQRCYEAHKVLTYPRTDSRCLPNDYRTEVDRIVSSLAGVAEFKASAKFLQANGRQNESKIFNDAGVSDHFAIIPTGHTSRAMKGDDEKLFDFVARRFLAAFHPPAVWEQVERDTVVIEKHHFISRARTLREPGWRSVYDQVAGDGEDAAKLPPLAAGQDKADNVAVKTVEANSEAEQTKPPPRLTEARLLSLMENAGKQIEDEDVAAAMRDKGLGTPATRADTIENLKSKDYVNKSLRPTTKGIRLIDMLHRINASRLTSAELTGELELHLSQVEHDTRDEKSFMSEITDYTRDIVEQVRTFEYDQIFPNENPLGICPCPDKRPVYERGWFYRCQEVPDAAEDCPFRIWKDKSGRFLDRATVTTLLHNGKTGEVDGFRDRMGRTYKGVLEIEDKEVRLRPIAGSEQQAVGDAAPVMFEVNPEPLGPCPIHKEETVVETPTDFISTHRQRQLQEGERKPTGFFLPRIVCKREMKREDAIAMMTTGETPLIEDFISRFGRPFKAQLKMKPDGRHTFEFPPRPAGTGRGRWGKKGKSEDTAEAAPASADEKGKPTRKSAAKKKVVEKKPAAKKTSVAKKKKAPVAKKKTAKKKSASKRKESA